MIGQIEDAIIARIEAAAAAGGVLGYRFRAVATYSGEMDQEVKHVAPSFPACWVAYMGEDRPEPLGDGTYRHEPTFALVIAARNVRNERARRHGSVGEVGTYQMLEDLRALLSGKDLGLEIRDIEPGATRQLVNRQVQDQKLSVLTLELHTAYETKAALPDANIEDFLTFHADWDIPGGADAEEPLPAAEKDAEDTVTLPGPEE